MSVGNTREAATLLNEVLEHLAQVVHGGGLGFSSQSHILQIGLGRTDTKKVVRSICPSVNGTPARFRPVMRALDHMPMSAKSAIIHKHLYPGTAQHAAQVYSVEHNVSVATFYRRVEFGYWYIMGACCHS